MLKPPPPQGKTGLFTAGTWLVSLVAFVAYKPAQSTAFLWPLSILSLLFFATCLRVLFASPENTLLAHYASLDSMKSVQRAGLFSFLCLPLIGGIQLVFFYPLFLAEKSTHPLLGLTNSLLVYALLSLFLWSKKKRWAVFGVALLAGVTTGSLGYAWKKTIQPWHVWIQQLISLAVVATLLVAMFGLFLRWWRGAEGQHSAKIAAHVMLGVVLTSQIALLLVQPSTLQSGAGATAGMMLLCVLSWSSAQGLRDTHQLLRLPNAIPSLHCQPYVLGATLPFALLFALGGWARTAAVTPELLLWLTGVQLLAFSGYSTLYSIHRIGWGEPHPIWVFLRPILLFLVIFFPFGFPAIAMLKSLGL